MQLKLPAVGTASDATTYPYIICSSSISLFNLYSVALYIKRPFSCHSYAGQSLYYGDDTLNKYAHIKPKYSRKQQPYFSNTCLIACTNVNPNIGETLLLYITVKCISLLATEIPQCT